MMNRVSPGSACGSGSPRRSRTKRPRRLGTSLASRRAIRLWNPRTIHASVPRLPIAATFRPDGWLRDGMGSPGTTLHLALQPGEPLLDLAALGQAPDQRQHIGEPAHLLHVAPPVLALDVEPG